MIAVKGFVYGRVQGVWFRKHVQQGCLELGLKGYARNLSDGRVEVLLVGNERQVEVGKSVVERGSPNSRVLSIEWSLSPESTSVEGFLVL